MTITLQMSNHSVLKTNISAIDNLLGGGLKPQRVYEFYGSNWSDITVFLCQLICINFSNKTRVWSSKIIYFDINSLFHPPRLERIGQAYGIDTQSVLCNIGYLRGMFFEQLQYICMVYLEKIILETGAQLIFFDMFDLLSPLPFDSPYREKGGIYLNKKGIGLGNRMIESLKELAIKYNLIIILTSTMTGNTRALGLDHVDESYIMESRYKEECKYVQGLSRYCINKNTYKITEVFDNKYLILERYRDFPKKGELIKLVSPEVLREIDHKEYRMLKKAHRTHRKLKLRTIKISKAPLHEEARQIGLGHFLYLNIMHDIEIGKIKAKNILRPDDFSYLEQFMGLELKNKLFPLETLLDWAERIYKGERPCPISLIPSKLKRAYRLRDGAGGSYGRLKLKGFIKLHLGNFIICMAIDKIREKIGILPKNYYKKELRAFQKDLKYMLNSQCSITGEELRNWFKVEFVNTKKIVYLKETKKRDIAELEAMGMIRKHALLLVACDINYEKFNNYINNGLKLKNLKDLLSKLHETNKQFHITSVKPKFDDLKRWFVYLLLGKRENSKKNKRLKKVTALIPDIYDLLVLSGYDYISLKYYMGDLEPLLLQVNNVNDVFGLASKPIILSRLKSWLEIIRGPNSKGEKRIFKKLKKLYGVGNKYATLLLLSGITFNTLKNTNKNYKEIYQIIVHFNNLFNVVEKLPSLEYVWEWIQQAKTGNRAYFSEWYLGVEN